MTKDTPASTPTATSTPSEKPAAVVQVRSANREKFLNSLPQSEREAMVTRDSKSQGAAVATEAHNPGPDGSTPSPASKPADKADQAEGATPPAKKDVETFTLGEETSVEPAPEQESEPAEIPAEQLTALSEDVKKKLAERDKENVKVRHRAQEAEKKLKEEQDARANDKKEIETLRAKLQETHARGGLTDNVFAKWEDPKAVSQWENAAQAIIEKANKIALARGTGEEIPQALLKVKLPNGNEVELTSDLYDEARGWIADAGTWRDHNKAVSKARETAEPIVAKLSKMEGYTAARESYLADPDLHARLPEIVAKAAMFDVFEARKGTITFPGKAGAATSAPSSDGDEAQGPTPKTTPTPPREPAASTPRLAPSAHAGSNERSAQKQRAMMSGDEDEIKAALRASKNRGGE